eukprot:3623119-Pyramimonas_sp.AAC.1
MDQFEKIKTLGRGAQGTVILVRRKADRAKFCIKKIYIEDQSLEDQEAVMNEIKVRAAPAHSRSTIRLLSSVCLFTPRVFTQRGGA